MSLPFHAEAELEMVRALRQHELIDPELSADFNDKLTDALERIESRPQQFPLAEDGPNDFEIRNLAIRRFPFRIVYWCGSLGTIVIAVAHLHREPGYWEDRLLDYS